MSYPTPTRGRPLVLQSHSNPEGGLINEQGLVAETSSQSINTRHGSYGKGDRIVSPRYYDKRFLLAGPYQYELASDRRKHAQSDKRRCRRKYLDGMVR
jgi:hypothetical protein